jgi:hypothetical protein
VADFETFEDVKRWLKESERMREDILVFAGRAALRAVPALATGLKTEQRLDELSSAFVLSVFRAMGAPHRQVQMYPERRSAVVPGLDLRPGSQCRRPLAVQTAGKQQAIVFGR